MKTILSAITISLLFISCATSAPESAKPSKKTKVQTEVDSDLKEELTLIENKAWEAWVKKDKDLMGEILSDDFLNVAGNGVTDKESTVALVAKNPCTLESYQFSDEQTSRFGVGLVLLTSTTDSEFECNGKTGLSPTINATLYSARDDVWKAVFHQSVPAENAEGDMPELPPVNKSKLADKDDELTQALAAVEKAIWKSWDEGDLEKFEGYLANNFISVLPTGKTDRATVLKHTREANCVIEDYALDGMRSLSLGNDSGLLIYRAQMNGSCGETRLPDHIWASTIFKKTGKEWKAIFHMESAV